MRTKKKATPGRTGAAGKKPKERPRLDEQLDAKIAAREREEALTPRPGKFITQKGLKVKTLAQAVEAAGLIASDGTEALYHYRDGLWLTDGVREVQDRTRHLLDERWRPSHAEAVVKWFRARPPRFTDDNFDTRYLNLPNGMLDWRTEELVPWSPNINSVARVPVRWYPDAECARIRDWLDEVLPDDCVDLAFEIAGYMLLNDNPFQKAVMLHGEGANGKGTYQRLLARLVGFRNVSSVSPQSLDENRWSAAELHGKLANIVGDVDPRIFKMTENFKKATGGDLLTAERKYGALFQFTCRALMVASFNRYPRSSDTTTGFFRRWVVLPFPHHFPDGVADPGIEDKLQLPEELEGFLVEAVRGLQRVHARGGFAVPVSVKEATKHFREAADPVRAFISERVTYAEGERPARTSVFSAWADWCGDNGHEPGSSRAFYGRFLVAATDVLEHQIGEVKSKGIACFKDMEVSDGGPKRLG